MFPSKSEKSFPKPGHDHDSCIADALRNADEICKSKGLRFTALRRRVLEIIWAKHEPTGAYDILEELSTNKARAAPPTVYRALNFLLKHGFVHKIESLNAFLGCVNPETLTLDSSLFVRNAIKWANSMIQKSPH